MQFARAVRGIASACLVSVLAACGGGGGGGGDSYPSDDTIVLDSGTSSTAKGSYKATNYGTDSVFADGVTIESLYTDLDSFGAGIDYVSTDSTKFVLWFADDTGFFACRSAAMNLPTAADLVVCNREVKFDLAGHKLRFKNVILADDDVGTGAKVMASGNLSW